jgi:drug/metabolite transporter (DMT)-like permease
LSPSFIGQAAALGTAFCWTITSLSFEAAGRRIGSLSVNIVRITAAFLIFVLVSFLVRGAPLPIDADASVWIWLTISGLIGFVLGDIFLFQAFVDVGARVAMVVYSSVPPMTALIGRLILGERLRPIQIVAMALTVTGILIVTTTPRRHDRSPGAHPVRGVWFAALGAFGQALGLVLSRYGAPTYDPFGATQIRALAGTIGFAILVTFRRHWRAVWAALRDARAMRHTARGAFFGPFLGVSLGLFAAQRSGTGVAATIIATVPVLLIPVTVFLFHERVTMRETFGALVAVGGVALLFLA